MRICLVSREYPPNPMGGIGTYMVNMSSRLVAAGHSVTVVTQWHPECGLSDQGPLVREDGRLRVYFLPMTDAQGAVDPRAASPVTLALAAKDPVAVFTEQVADLLDRMVLEEGIDVIEAPEYEAALLHFQMRRLTLPANHPLRTVPCVVQLHSPSADILRHNDESLITERERFRTRQELQSILAADAVLSPSRFLADEVSGWAPLPRESIEVIPYPLGEPLPGGNHHRRHLRRYLFVGRIEPRKGVFEYVEAACRAAADLPDARFLFLGGTHVRMRPGVPAVETRTVLRHLIPESIRDRFEFRGAVSRDRLRSEIGSAWFCVVPSRWENFPHTCMEAMDCGTPVIASDQGGMADMIEDGVSGFVVNGADRRDLSRELETALRRTARLSADEVERMGENAQRRIRVLCDNREIVRRHVEFFARAMEKVRRQSPPASPPCRVAVGLFVPARADREGVQRVIDSVRNQAQAPDLLLAACGGNEPEPLELLRTSGWRALRLGDDARNDGDGIRRGWWSEQVESAGAEEAHWLFLGPGADLEPDFLRAACAVLQSCPDAGFVTAWASGADGNVDVSVDTEPLFLLLREHSPAILLLRGSAVRDSGGVEKRGLYFDDALRDLCLRMLDGGWRGVVIPRVLLPGRGRLDYPCWSELGFHSRQDSALEVLQGHPEIAARQADTVGRLLMGDTFTARPAMAAPTLLARMRAGLGRALKIGR